MNRVILVIFALVLCAPLAVAQDMPDAPGDSNSVAGSFSLRTFRGCLSHTGDQYELTVSGAVPHQYRLIGSNLAQLDDKAGHLVSITGTMPNNPVAANATAPESDTINFLSLDDLAATCGAPSGARPAAEISNSPIASMALVQQPWQSLAPTAISIPMPEPQPQPGSYMVVPLVGALALGLLQLARHLRRN